MKLIFKYNRNALYLTRDLKERYAGNYFSVLDIYLNEKVQSVKIHFLNIFKDHDTVAELSLTAIYYDRWSLSNDLWIKFYRDHGKYDPELS